MTKIMVDTEKIGKDLINDVKKTKSYITYAKQTAQKVNFPNDEYDWSNITSHISDCEDELNKYINWMNELNKNYKSNINEFIDKLDKIQVDKLEFNNLNVK